MIAVHVHDYEKLWLGLAIGLILLLIGTVTYGAVGPGVSMVADDGGTIDPEALDEDDRFAEPRVERTGDDEYDAYVVARQFFFQPDPIVVPANSRVTFHVTSPDVIHGFEIVGTGANTMVIPGEVAQFTVEVQEPREYGIICNEYCGVAHHEMEGTLRVVPQDEFEAANDGTASDDGDDASNDGGDGA